MKVLTASLLFPRMHLRWGIGTRGIFVRSGLMSETSLTRWRVWIPVVQGSQNCLNNSVYFSHRSNAGIATHESLRYTADLFIPPRLEQGHLCRNGAMKNLGFNFCHELRQRNQGWNEDQSLFQRYISGDLKMFFFYETELNKVRLKSFGTKFWQLGFSYF